MQFSGSVEIGAPRDRVYAFVIDPDKVGFCGPGVESIETIDADHFKARAKVGIGFISMKFALDLEFLERTPSERAVIKAHGLAPGSAVDGTGSMSLRDGDKPGTTVMDWSADVQLAGTVASMGARLIEGTASKMIAQTFDCISARLISEVQAEEAVAGGAAGAEERAEASVDSVHEQGVRAEEIIPAGPHRPEDHAEAPGHERDDHAPAEPALGPIDWRAWGAGGVGLVVGLTMAAAFAVASGLIRF
jgi:carbon monoxide dehydrogenase subunit G